MYEEIKKNLKTDIQKMAPIVVFAYNRVDKISTCLRVLEKCPESKYSDLYIFADGYKGEKDRESVQNVHKYLRDYLNNSAFKTVHLTCRDRNIGLANSVISGVTEIINQYGKVIVVEDDLIVSNAFLNYMNGALNYYQEYEEYGSISAYCYPTGALKDYDKDVFCTHKAECWGWATWADRWNNADWTDTDFEEYLNNIKKRIKFEKLEAGLDRLMYLQKSHRIDSWAIRWVYYLFNNDKLTVYPTKSYVMNDGFDGSGTHCDKSDSGYAAETNIEHKTDTRFERLHAETKLEIKYGQFARRRFPMYLIERWTFLIKR